MGRYICKHACSYFPITLHVEDIHAFHPDRAYGLIPSFSFFFFNFIQIVNYGPLPISSDVSLRRDSACILDTLYNKHPRPPCIRRLHQFHRKHIWPCDARESGCFFINFFYVLAAFSFPVFIFFVIKKGTTRKSPKVWSN